MCTCLMPTLPCHQKGAWDCMLCGLVPGKLSIDQLSSDTGYNAGQAACYASEALQSVSSLPSYGFDTRPRAGFHQAGTLGRMAGSLSTNFSNVQQCRLHEHSYLMTDRHTFSQRGACCRLCRSSTRVWRSSTRARRHVRQGKQPYHKPSL